MQRSVAALADHATAAVYTAASSRPRGQPNVFLYSDPGAGRAYGYRFDGWTQDRSVFLYTGEGTNGDQQFTDGNLAVQRHAEQARALRVFVADGSEPGGNTKIQRYLGQFRLDVDRPTATAEAPDTDGNLRSVIVFRLVPVSPVLRRSEDDSAVGDVSTEPRLDRVDHGDLTITAGSAEAVPVEVVAARGHDVAGSASTAAVKREAELVMRYQAHLEQQGHTCVRYRIRPPGELRDLYTDIFDETKNILYEAKGVATREAVRMAVGQLLDYKRHLPNSPTLSILLPAEPSYDLTDFMRRNGIRCVYPEPGGSFRGV